MQKALIGSAILAMVHAQFGDSDFEESEPLVLEEKSSLKVSDLTVAIEEQNDICKKDFEKYMNGLGW